MSEQVIMYVATLHQHGKGIVESQAGTDLYAMEHYAIAWSALRPGLGVRLWIITHDETTELNRTLLGAWIAGKPVDISPRPPGVAPPEVLLHPKGHDPW